MAAESRRISVIGMDGHEIVSLGMPGTATVEDLQQEIFAASGTHPLAQRLVLSDRILPAASPLQDAGVEDGAQLTLVVTFPAVEYRVMQGVVLKKSGAEPSVSKVLKWQRKVGSKIRTTGQIWTGPAGGEWVEVDPSAEKPGWLFIRGPGFNLRGPLLEEVAPGEEEPRILLIRSPVEDDDLRELCLKPSFTLWEVKCWIGIRLPGLRPERMVIVKQRVADRSARFTPGAWILPDEMTVRETAFADGDELPYLYVGDPEDYLEASQ